MKSFSKTSLFYVSLVLLCLLGAVFIFDNLSITNPKPVDYFKTKKGVFLEKLSNGIIASFNRNLFLNQFDALLGGFSDFSILQENSLASISSPQVLSPKVLGSLGDDNLQNSKEITEYTIKEGDSLWSISERFGLTIDTIAWANDIESPVIQPGQKLLVPPVDGVIHQVKAGDTLSGIAERYKAKLSDIFSFNDITTGEQIYIGQVLVVPGGKVPSYGTNRVESVTFTNHNTNYFYGRSHSYPYGQCTWLVAQKRAIPSWGNAVDWLRNATVTGYATCRGRYCQPQIGAVISLKGHPIYGHVGYVVQVFGNKVKFIEMNYLGQARVNYRTLTIGDPQIRGYIY